MNQQPMQLAIESALEGIKKEGGPFGACITKNNEIIAIAHNTVLKENDPTCHAEMNAIRLAAKKLGNYILSDCTLYTTAEPCPMCLAAIYWARIPKIIIGVDKSIAAAYGFDDAFIYEEMKKHHDLRIVKCEMGILSTESEAVFKKWKETGLPLY